MILVGISRYRAHFKGIGVISELAIFCNAQFLSSWDISRQSIRDSVAFMYWEPSGTKVQLSLKTPFWKKVGQRNHRDGAKYGALLLKKSRWFCWPTSFHNGAFKDNRTLGYRIIKVSECLEQNDKRDRETDEVWMSCTFKFFSSLM